MAMLSQELSSIKDRDVPSQVEAGAAAAQSTMPCTLHFKTTASIEFEDSELIVVV